MPRTYGEDEGELSGNEPEMQPSAARPKAPMKGKEDAMDQTEVYSRDYLNRIRQTPDERDADDEEKPALTEEEAALLSGSTGQYRLSKRTGSVRGNTPEPASRRVEDPEDFARKQRSTRAGQDAINFYDDDDGEGSAPTTRRRK